MKIVHCRTTQDNAVSSSPHKVVWSRKKENIKLSPKELFARSQKVEIFCSLDASTAVKLMKNEVVSCWCSHFLSPSPFILLSLAAVIYCENICSHQIVHDEIELLSFFLENASQFTSCYPCHQTCSVQKNRFVNKSSLGFLPSQKRSDIRPKKVEKKVSFYHHFVAQ